MRNGTISVTMPNYNHGKYIGEALAGILHQTYPPLEVIVVDDGSNDNSVEIIENFARESSIVKLIRNQRNMGVNYSLKRAIGCASGEYICFQSADDKVLPGFFAKSMDVLRQYPHAGLCCSDPSFFDAATGIIYRKSQLICSEPRYFSPDLLVELMQQQPFHIAGHTSVVKRSAVIAAGGMIDALKWHCDWFALLVIAFRHGICYVPEALASMRVSNSRYSSGISRIDSQEQVLRAMLALLHTHEFRDVFASFKHSGVLACFGKLLFRLVVLNKEYRDLLSWPLMRRVVLQGLKSRAAQFAPDCVRQICRDGRARSYLRQLRTRAP